MIQQQAQKPNCTKIKPADLVILECQLHLSGGLHVLGPPPLELLVGALLDVGLQHAPVFKEEAGHLEPVRLGPLKVLDRPRHVPLLLKVFGQVVEGCPNV